MFPRSWLAENNRRYQRCPCSPLSQFSPSSLHTCITKCTIFCSASGQDAATSYCRHCSVVASWITVKSKLSYIPADTRRWINVGLTLVQRRRRWTNVEPTLIQRIVSAGIGRTHVLTSVKHNLSHCTLIWSPTNSFSDNKFVIDEYWFEHKEPFGFSANLRYPPQFGLMLRQCLDMPATHQVAFTSRPAGHSLGVTHITACPARNQTDNSDVKTRLRTSLQRKHKWRTEMTPVQFWSAGEIYWPAMKKRKDAKKLSRNTTPPRWRSGWTT